MMKLSIFAFALLLASAVAYNSCYVDIPVDELPSYVVDPIPQLSASDIPEQWLWANVSGTSFLTLVRSQMSPQYCGACWAFATTSALADRIKIQRNAYWPDMDLAPQILLSCSQGQNQGCTGGNPAIAHQYIYNYGIAHESCSNYQAAGWDTGVGCSQAILCKNCYMNRTCYLPETYPIYQIEEYGNIQGEEAMLNEVYQRGPIVCGIDVRGLESYTGGIINDTTGLNELNHAVSIVGYGVDNGTPYWHVRASWGTHYGEDGFFRIVRGTNNLGIETSCQWATMVDTWTQTTLNTTDGALLSPEANAQSVFDPTDDEDFTNTNSSDASDMGCAQVDASEMGVCFSSSGKYPWENLNTSVVPTGWDWRNVSGVNYCSWTRNQHIAKYCGACWAFAATSALADRINIASNLTITDLALSVQALINCKAGGTCGGGSPGKVFEWALTHGIPEDSCQQYAFANPAEYTCSDVQLCQKCFPSSDGTPNCTAVPNYRKWMVSEHGSVVGVELMKKAIYSGGPIACGIDATDGFRAYTGGIYSEVVANPKVNHIISLVGWGVEDGTEYWILRNHAGNFWGENGFMRIVTGGNNLGVENYCTWATPIVSGSDDSDAGLGTGDFVGSSGDIVSM